MGDFNGVEIRARRIVVMEPVMKMQYVSRRGIANVRKDTMAMVQHVPSITAPIVQKIVKLWRVIMDGMAHSVWTVMDWLEQVVRLKRRASVTIKNRMVHVVPFILDGTGKNVWTVSITVSTVVGTLV
jgi:hypothetical protein